MVVAGSPAARATMLGAATVEASRITAANLRMTVMSRFLSSW
jgi:hypothetical protein